MSFIYRPTPVITLTGKTVGDDHVPLTRLPAGTMHGYARNMDSPALNAIGRRTISGNPWLVRSGTMGSFLGQDSGLPSDFFSGLTATPSLPDAGLPADFFSGASMSPIAPTSTLLTPTLPAISVPGFSPSGALFPAVAPPAAPSVAAPSVATQAVGAGTSILSSISNFFKPKTSTTPMIAAQPGVYSATTTTPSWFSQQTLLPGISNTMALLGGAAVLVLFAGLATSGKGGK